MTDPIKKNNDTFIEPIDEAEAILETGTILAGKYQLDKLIGRGGMGVVWRAKDQIAHRLVALKFVPKEMNRFDAEMKRVRESFGKVHALSHESICPLYSLENDPDHGYYLVMKYLEGETLDEFVSRKDPNRKGLPLEPVLEWLTPVAKALDYAHRNDVIHRDIKPSNIFLVFDASESIRDVQVIDFGLADEIKSSMSRVSQVKFDTSGTRPYMAPEQWRGWRQTAATDQYALAVIAYELLSGHLPFEITDFEMLQNAVLNFPPEPIPSLSEQANTTLQKGLAKESVGRFESCIEFISSLDGSPISSTPKKASHSTKREPKPAAPGVESLMKRGHLFLEDAEWKQADEYFDRVLDIDPEYAPAWVGKLCVELKIPHEKTLGDCENSIFDQKHFQKAVRFADEEYKAKIEGYDETIRERLRQEQYDRLVQEKSRAVENDFPKLAERFRSMNGYKDTAELANECDKQYRTLKKQWEEQEGNEQEQRRQEEEQRRLEQKRKRGEQYRRLSEEAKKAETAEDWRRLAEKFRALNGYRNTAELADQCDRRREKARRKYRNCIAKFYAYISAGDDFTVGLKADGTVVAVGYTPSNFQYWRDIVAVSAGNLQAIGLKSDGTVVAGGNVIFGQPGTQNWRDIVAVSAESFHAVGLKSDGTVVGYNHHGTQNWRDIVAVSVGCEHTVGLKADGTVVAVGHARCDTSNWRDIVAVSVGSRHTVGLKSDGTVVAVGNNVCGECNTQDWRDIVAVSAGGCNTVGLKSDGTVVVVGSNYYDRCDIQNWRDIVAVSAGNFHAVGLKSDGTVVATGKNEHGQCNTQDWRDIGLFPEGWRLRK